MHCLLFVLTVAASTVAAGAAAGPLTLIRNDHTSTSGARAIVSADFDRNGWPDLAHANVGRNSVAILLNDRGERWTRGAEVPVGVGPFDLTTADFNRDSVPDLAVANADSHSISILLGKGDGTFTRGDIAASGQNPRGITTGDVNNDGKPDLAYTGYATRSVQVLIGDGAGRFSRGPAYVGSAIHPQGLAAADLNRDGRLDLAVAYESGLRVLYGDGGATFTARAVSGASSLNVVVTADVNADGWVDVAAASSATSTVAIYLGGPSGLAFVQLQLTGTSPRGITAADVNHDGALDLITGNRGSNTVSVLLADPSRPGRFLSDVEFAAGAGSRDVVAADFNADGRLDLATGNEYSASATVLSNATLFTRAAYVFSRQPLYAPRVSVPWAGSRVWPADFDRDGKLDVATVTMPGDDEPADLSVVLSGGRIVSLPRIGWYPQAAGVGDVNGDGNPDFIYYDAQYGLYPVLGDGRGGFAAAPPTLTPLSIVDVHAMGLGDLNRDGATDAVIVGYDNEEPRYQVLTLLSNRDGTFRVGVQMMIDGVFVPGLTVVDVNRDGKPDVAAVMDGTLLVFTGDGRGGLSAPDVVSLGNNYGCAVNFGDMNRDGYLDAVVTGAWGVDIAPGSADGFNTVARFSVGDQSGGSALADIDADGDLDVVTAGGTVLHGDGEGAVGHSEAFEYSGMDVAVAEFTGDALLDIVYITADGEVVVLANERNDINRTPVVNAGPDRTLEYQDLQWVDGDRACFNVAADGDDPDVHRLSYEWRDGSGALVAQSREFTLCTSPGAYAFDVRVTDGRGGAAASSVVLTVVPTKEIVLHVADAQEYIGRWSAVADSTAAGGFRAYTPNLGAPKVMTPVPYPDNFVGIRFVADPTQLYKLWVRLKADHNSWANDSVWIQFSGAATAAGIPAYQLGSSSGLAVNLEECVNCGVSGWGWEDDGWGAVNANGGLLRFPYGGEQYLWIQPREDGVSIDQIVLSAEKYLTTRPGAAKNDATILHRTFPQ